MTETAPNYRAGTLYALITTALLSAQHPFSLPAAQRLSVINFVFATQVIILLSVPILLRTANARRDFRKLILSAGNYKYFLVLFLIGLGNHVLYFLALSKARPITISAVMNLSPFWAALIALVIAKKIIPTTYAVFFGCLAVAFGGAMMIAFSQIGDTPGPRSSFYWLFAVPVPILFALSGTLIAKWFADYDEMACIAVTFVTASLVLIPVAASASYLRADLPVLLDSTSDLLLLAVGTVLGSAVGLVIYQTSLSVTGNDNGFVSMFFLLGPGLTALLSLAMSPWLPQLKFPVGPIFFVGLATVAAAMLVFSWQARKGKPEAARPSDRVAEPLASGTRQ